MQPTILLTMRLSPAVLGLAAFISPIRSRTSGRAAEVNVEADLGQTVLDTRSSDRVYLGYPSKRRCQEPGEKRSPVNVAVVIDRSGSMQGERIAAAKKVRMSRSSGCRRTISCRSSPTIMGSTCSAQRRLSAARATSSSVPSIG